MFSHERLPTMFLAASESILLACLLVVLISDAAQSSDVDLSSCRTEGRIILFYEKTDGKSSKHELTFSESIDALDKKFVVSIGYIGHAPEKYYKLRDQQTIVINRDGKCSKLPSDQRSLQAISWMIDLIMPKVEIENFVSKSEDIKLMGPTGIVQRFVNMAESGGAKDMIRDPPSRLMYRNILCDLDSKKFKVKGDAEDKSIHLEILKPGEGVVEHNLEQNYFSIRVTTSMEHSEYKRAGFIIDYFDIELMDDEGKRESMQKDFNLPLGLGCSAELDRMQPEFSHKSFLLEFAQESRGAAPRLVAYDDKARMLRKELVGVSASIWDLDEDLLYHVNKDLSQSIGDGTSLVKDDGMVWFKTAATCSMMRVADTNLGPALRPYKQSGKPIHLIDLIGLTDVAYMGRGSVRNMPCHIYETISSEPPAIFGLSKHQISGMSGSRDEIDFVVEFYLLDSGDKTTQPERGFVEQVFFPARIVLLRRDLATGEIQHVDQIDVDEFLWSQGGWLRRRTELFMPSECFDEESGQVNLEFAIQFEEIHSVQSLANSGASTSQNFSGKDDHDQGSGDRSIYSRSTLARNRLQLETSLIDSVLDIFPVKKSNVVQYKVELRPNHINLDLVIGDSDEQIKQLTYMGTVLLAAIEAKARPIRLAGIAEEPCLLVGSLISGVTEVYHCQDETSSQGPVCVTITDEAQPANTPAKRYGLDGSSCRKYGFKIEESTRSKKAVGQISTNQFKVVGSRIDIVLGNSAKERAYLHGRIQGFEFTHATRLLDISGYSFAIHGAQADSSTKDFKSLSYGDIGDCIRACNLDSTCRSYSYCHHDARSNDANQCILSTLDFRTPDVSAQLVNAGESMAIVDKRGKRYHLQSSRRCGIHERDYLGMFRQTDEIVRLPEKIVPRRTFQSAPTTFDCAKQSVDLELLDSNATQAAMFAYCGSKNLCILDQQLFAPTHDAADQSAAPPPTEFANDRELLCNVFRRKYMTYFDVSSEIINAREYRNQQVELAYESAEECARACWNQYGQVCASFDFCTPGTCLINQVSTRSSPGLDTEVKSSCLHYERNLEWDKLREEHQIGRHTVLNPKEEQKSWVAKLWYSFSVLTVVGSIIYGLAIGQNHGDDMSNLTLDSLQNGLSNMFERRRRRSENGDTDEILDDEDEPNFCARGISLEIFKRS